MNILSHFWFAFFIFRLVFLFIYLFVCLHRTLWSQCPCIVYLWTLRTQININSQVYWQQSTRNILKEGGIMCWSSDCVTQTHTQAHAHTNLMVVLNRQVKCHPSTKQRSNKCVRNDTEKIESNDWTNERTNGRTDGRQFIRLIFDLLFIMNLRDFTICWHFRSQHIVTSFIRKKKIMEESDKKTRIMNSINIFRLNADRLRNNLRYQNRQLVCYIKVN